MVTMRHLVVCYLDRLYAEYIPSGRLNVKPQRAKSEEMMTIRCHSQFQVVPLLSVVIGIELALNH
jgi:hypothetical protein